MLIKRGKDYSIIIYVYNYGNFFVFICRDVLKLKELSLVKGIDFIFFILFYIVLLEFEFILLLDILME